METCAGSHTKKYDQELLQCEILFEFIWWAVAAILFLFLRIIFDVMLSFILCFLSKDNEELFATESRLLHGY
jgi:hypothetical protein